MATETVITREAPEIEAYRLGLIEQAKQLIAQPPAGGLPALTSQGMTAEQQQALDAASAGIASYQPYLDTAAQQFTASANPITGDMIDQYMNPYMDAVTAEISKSFAPKYQAASADAIGLGSFGGSRAALQQSLLGQAEADARSRAMADAYVQAQGAAERDLGRRFQLGQGLASLGQLQSQLQTQGIGQLAQLGEQERQILQAQDEATRQTGMQDIREPYTRLAFLSDIFKGAPSTQMVTSQQAAVQPGLLNQLLGAGIGGLSLYGAANRAFG
jgi:hypothetical protein|tara:strand:+ start:354 stop:1172 length:819 start_codon:yes stop_codon:yes gene_type:complete